MLGADVSPGDNLKTAGVARDTQPMADTPSPIVTPAASRGALVVEGDGPPEDAANLSLCAPTPPAAWSGDEMIQVINGDGTLSCPTPEPSGEKDQPRASPRRPDTVVEFLEKTQFVTRGLDYQADVTRERTTHGVWLGLPKRSPAGPGSLLVLDVEGTDGSMRADELSFERKASLFTLTVSSLLIVNLWYQDIGRYNAANLALLKTVFELNVQLFARAESPKTLILFVIRDHTATPLAKLQEILTASMNDIWESMNKPPAFRDAPITRFFDFEFTSLPHMLLQKEKFDVAVGALRDRFVAPGSPGFYLQEKYRKLIPADGFSVFIRSVWEAIRENKDLDLPSQRHMLAMFRCEEMSESAFAGFLGDMAPIAAEIEGGWVAENFAERAGHLYTEWLRSYSEPASRYAEEVSQKKGDALRERMAAHLQRLFRLQLSHEADRALAELDAALERISAAPASETIGADIAAAQRAAQRRWDGVARASAVGGLEWAWDAEAGALQQAAAERGAAVRARMLDAAVGEAREALGRELSDRLAPLLEAAAPDRMWPDARAAFAAACEGADARVGRIAAAFGAEAAEAVGLRAAGRRFAAAAVRSLVRARADYLSYHMEKRFGRVFATDAKGLPRRWRPRDDVGRVYLEAREGAELLADLYGFVKLDAAADPATFFGPAAAGVAERAVLDRPRLPPGVDAGAAVVVAPDELRGAVERFRKYAELSYLQAQRDQEAAAGAGGRVPPWLLLLVAALGFNELQMVLRNPLLLVLAIALGAAAWALHSLGLAGVALAFVSNFFAAVLRAAHETLDGIARQREQRRRRQDDADAAARTRLPVASAAPPPPGQTPHSAAPPDPRHGKAD